MKRYVMDMRSLKICRNGYGDNSNYKAGGFLK